MLKNLLVTTALTSLLISSAVAQSTPPAAGSTMNSASSSTISTQAAGQMLVSNLRGVDVMGSNNDKIGDISDILISKDGKVEAFLLSIGGFLGVGAKEVALAPSSVQLTQDSNNNWKATVSMSKDQLAQAPNFERAKDRPTTTGSGMTSGSSTTAPRNATTPGGAMSPTSNPAGSTTPNRP